jgi:hypothetical protein
VGWNFFHVVDIDASLEEAPALADRVAAWLVAAGVVAEPATTDPDGRRRQYPRGPRLGDWAERAEDRDQNQRNAWSVELTVGRGVYLNYTLNDTMVARCPRRHERTIPAEGLRDLFEIVDEWYSDRGPAQLVCDECSRSYAITEWLICPDFALGNLAVSIFQVLPFSQEFVDAIGQVLAPHRVVSVFGFG